MAMTPPSVPMIDPRPAGQLGAAQNDGGDRPKFEQHRRHWD
jgi:hypothetical protein